MKTATAPADLIATVDEKFAEIDRLVRDLRKRIALASEAVHVAREKAASRTIVRRIVAKVRT